MNVPHIFPFDKLNEFQQEQAIKMANRYNILLKDALFYVHLGNIIYICQW